MELYAAEQGQEHKQMVIFLGWGDKMFLLLHFTVMPNNMPLIGTSLTTITNDVAFLSVN